MVSGARGDRVGIAISAITTPHLYTPPMPSHALWKSAKHYLQQAPPAVEHDSVDYLEGFARGRGWSKPAIIAELHDDGWWPVMMVYASNTKNYTPAQPIKYFEVRRTYYAGKPLPAHLGEALTDLSQDV